MVLIVLNYYYFPKNGPILMFCSVYLARIEKKRIRMFLEEESKQSLKLKSETPVRRQVRRLGVQGDIWSVIWRFSEWGRPGTSETAS